MQDSDKTGLPAFSIVLPLFLLRALAHHLGGLGFSLDSERTPLDFLFPCWVPSFLVGTFALWRLKLTTPPMRGALCNSSNIWATILVLEPQPM